MSTPAEPNSADRALADMLVTQISPGGAWQAEAFRSGVALHERSKRTDCIRDPHTEIHRILEDQVQTAIAAHRSSAVAEAVERCQTPTAGLIEMAVKLATGELESERDSQTRLANVALADLQDCQEENESLRDQLAERTNALREQGEGFDELRGLYENNLKAHESSRALVVRMREAIVAFAKTPVETPKEVAAFQAMLNVASLVPADLADCVTIKREELASLRASENELIAVKDAMEGCFKDQDQPISLRVRALRGWGDLQAALRTEAKGSA